MRHVDPEQAGPAPEDAEVRAHPTPAPRLLLIATMPWMLSVRLAKALRKVGFHVEAVCRVGHPLRCLGERIPMHRLGWLREEASCEAAIRSVEPDLVIPCDDPAVGILHALHRHDRSGSLSALIETSLGDPAGFAVAEGRSALIALARSMRVCVPRSEVVHHRTRAGCGPRSAFPCVLKRDQTWSGMGVRVVHSEAELRRAWSHVAGWLGALRACKAAMRDRRARTFLDFFAHDAVVELQEFVPGSPANRAILCRAGRVMGGISVLAEQTAYPGGPASVVRIIDHPEMAQVAALLAERLGLSGFCGFDFVISPSGQAHLIELNPRATPIIHLAIDDGTHLPAALYREMTGTEPKVAPSRVPGDLIALFPTEWQRDPASAFLRHAHHDAPWDEPALLQSFGLTSQQPALRRQAT